MNTTETIGFILMFSGLAFSLSLITKEKTRQTLSYILGAIGFVMINFL